MKLITTAAALKSEIAKIKAAGKDLDNTIQIVALSCLQYAEKHGQVTPANMLYHAMPRGSRRNALVEWMVTFGKLRVMSKDESKAAMASMKEAPENAPVLAYDKDRSTDMEAAEATPWYEFRKEKPPAEVFDVQAAVAALIKRIRTAQAQQAQGKMRLDHTTEALDEVKTLAEMLVPSKA